MEYESILKRIMPKVKKGLDEYYKDQEELSSGLFEANFEPLDDAAGTIKIDYNKPNQLFNHKLRQNLGYFSARKTLAEQDALHKILFDDEGKIKPFSKFSKDASSVIQDYNRNWLAAEYKTTLRSGRMAAAWEEAQRDKDLYPNIEYLPSRAATPREEHKRYYHIIRPVDDPFWDEHLPPNGWQCLCRFKTTEKNATDLPKDLPQPAPGLGRTLARPGSLLTQVIRITPNTSRMSGL